MNENSISDEYVLERFYNPHFENERRNRIDADPRTFNLQSVLPRNIFVIGCGGIGSWISLILGTSLDHNRSLVMLDSDIIEISNLGRTLFSVFDVGRYKVEALANKISENNPNSNVIPYVGRFDENFFQEEGSVVFNNLTVDSSIFIDCRDDDYQDYDLIYKSEFAKRNKEFYGENENIYVLRVAYDSVYVTIDYFPEGRSVWGNRGYSVQPSHPVPSYISAMMACVGIFNCASIHNKRKNSKEDNFLFEPITFNVADFCNIVSMGNICNELIKSRSDKEKKTINKNFLEAFKSNDAEKLFQI